MCSVIPYGMLLVSVKINLLFYYINIFFIHYNIMYLYWCTYILYWYEKDYLDFRSKYDKVYSILYYIDNITCLSCIPIKLLIIIIWWLCTIYYIELSLQRVYLINGRYII